MFEQNIAELEKKNPKLAQKIKNHEEIKDIEVFQSESKNFIIAYKGILLHSNEDPLRETKSVWHKTIKVDLRENDIQVVYGLGLGYLFKRAYVSANSRILLYEPSLDILRFVFENVALASEIADERVFIFDNKKDIAEFFEKKYLPGDRIEVLFLPGYLTLPDSDLLGFSNEIYKILKDKNIDQNTIFLHAKDTVINFISRIDMLDKLKPVNCLEGMAKDKPALVIAAGPSLKKDLELIKKNKDKFITIAILPVLPVLLENGIEPDFVTVVDSSNQLFKIEKYKDKLSNINLIMESRTDANLNTLQTKSKFLYFPFVDKLSEFIVNSMSQKTIKELPSVASVSILSYELAKLLGCTKIVFSGLDLALTGNQAYGYDYIKVVGEENNTLTLECSKGIFQAKTTMVKSANGSDVKTREDYLLFIREFAKIAEQATEIELINTALDGALVEGMIYAPLSEVVENIKEPVDFNIDKLLKSIGKISLNDYKKKTIEIFENTQKEFKEFRPKIITAVSALEELLNEITSHNPDLDKFQKIFNENISTFSQTRNFLTNNFLLATYLQAEIAEFISTYTRDSQNSIKKIKDNIEVEFKLNKATLTAMDDLISLLDKK